MKRYGYDLETGALFSWEFDFQYEGKRMASPEGAVVSTDREEDEMAGCAFLSGWSGTFLVIRSDGENERFCLFGWDQRIGHWKGQNISQDNLRKMTARMPLCVCGKVVESPAMMSRLCTRFPSSRMYACPLVEELAAFGVLAKSIGKRPHRAVMVWDNKTAIDAESKAFDPVLDGDSMGRMADLVAGGFPVVNEVMSSIGVSPFYGRTLHKRWMDGSLFIVRMVEMDKFFPKASISAKNYAATSVPVKMETTEQFQALMGYNEPFADVFVATDYVPGVSTFMRFYKTICGLGIVCSSAQGSVRHGEIVPVFRSDKAYRVSRDKYEQSHGFLRREQDSGGRQNPV